MTWDWVDFLLTVVVLFINGRLTLWFYHWNNQRKGKKFLQMVKIENPNSRVTYVRASSRDDHALRMVKKQFLATQED